MVTKIIFHKYQGTGNDFIIIDNRMQILKKLDTKTIARWCDRKFGIGADGLMLLQNKKGFDFEMIYYNADGNISSMCGNGGRCITSFAYQLGILKDKKATFWAIDGLHEAVVIQSDFIELKMLEKPAVEKNKDFVLVDTGSPHYVQFVDNVKNIEVYHAGKKIRNSTAFKTKGINVNFVEIISPNQLKVATYERGVEDETLSCGTGVTAAAIAYHLTKKTNQKNIKITTKGGDLIVRFEAKEENYKSIWLCGATQYVFEGQISF